MTPKVLLVDDDPNILSAYSRTFRKRFQFDTALGGDEGLALLESSGPYSVILSDMRMPGMDGVQFLTRARELHPDSTRIMLTGNVDQQTAIDAVNRGHIFRFLTKPCEPEALAEALEAGIEQYRLVTAERELVEGTLQGSIDLLVELMSIADPAAFGRAQQLAPLTQKLAAALGLASPWVVTVASMLSPIGVLTLPAGVLARVRAGGEVPRPEREAVERLPEISANLIRHIPRMDPVAAAILYMDKNYDGSGFPHGQLREEEIPLAARILKVASGYLDLGSVEALRIRPGAYDPRVLDALAEALHAPAEVLEDGSPAPHLATHETVQPGQILVEGVQTREGLLVYPPLTRVGGSHLERLANFARLVGLKEPFLVLD